jgi:acetylcholinesterase
MYFHLSSWVTLFALMASSPLPGRAGSPQTTAALVDLGYAQYQGTHLSAGVNQYLGMRYAAPPL